MRDGSTFAQRFRFHISQALSLKALSLSQELVLIMTFLLAALVSLLQFRVANAVSRLEANTTSGPVQGFVNDTTPNVAQFLGIPFAEAPIGLQRFLPPLPKSTEDRTINATRFGPSCIQYDYDPNGAPPNVYAVDVPQFSISPFDYQSEDCLSVNIWAPWQDTANKSLPVLVWVYGGGYGQGGGNVPYQNPSQWVERSGKHIVVSVK